MPLLSPVANPRTPLLLATLLLVHLKALHAHPLENTILIRSHRTPRNRLYNSQIHLPLESLIAEHLRTKTLASSRERAATNSRRKQTAAISRQDQSSTGFTLDPCVGDQDCQTTQSGNRICVEFDDPESSDCPPGVTGCQCAPTFDPTCSTTADCDESEICATRFVDGATFCASERYVFDNPDIFLRNQAVSTGLTGDTCQSDADCQGERICAEDELGSSSCPQDAACFCFPDINSARCAVDWDCPIGETCAIVAPPEAEDVTASEFANNGTLDWVCTSITVVETSDSIFSVSEVYDIEDEELGVKGETGRMGLSYELCGQQDECMDGTTCMADRFDGGTNCGPRGCRCFPNFDVTCADTTVCHESEVCAAGVSHFQIGVCISQAVVDHVQPALQTLQPVPEGEVAEFPKGLTGDRCLFNSDCQMPRNCEKDTEGEGSCPVWGVCFCFQPIETDNSCTKDEDCDPGEGCFFGVDFPECLSKAAGIANSLFTAVPPSHTPTPSPASTLSSSAAGAGAQSMEASSPTVETGANGGAEPGTTSETMAGSNNLGNGAESPEVEDVGCVDARMIADLGRGDLVYKEDRWARALCDGWGSCATRGHVVVWEGRAMMMATYCAEVVGGCEEREMWVNSPKWRKGRRVAGRGGALEFTAFAARWATRLEEAVLRVAVHSGL